MPGPYPRELRERVLQVLVSEAVTQEEVAERFLVALRTVGRWVKAQATTGSVEPAPMGGARRPYTVDDEGAKFIHEALDCNPDLTLPELCALYDEVRSVRVSTQTMSDTVRRLGYTRKKGLFGALLRAGQKQLPSARRS